MKQKKALLINEGFSDNIGDQAISNGVKLLLESKNFSVKTAGFSTNNQCHFNLKKSSNNKLVTMLRTKILLKSIYWLFKNIIRILKCSSQKYNVAVIGGGQLIMKESNFAIAMFTWVVTLKIFNKKVCLFSVGVGENFNPFEKFLFLIAIKLADEILVREKSSVPRVLQQFGVHATYVPDAAYALSKGYTVKKDVILILITDYQVYVRGALELSGFIMTRSKYWDYWIDMIKREAQQDQIHFFWNTKEDEIETMKFLKYAKNEFSFIIYSNELSLEGVVGIFNRSKKVLSGRMHGLILGHIFGAECIPYYISNKVKRYVDEYLNVSPSLIQAELELLSGQVFEKY